MKNKNSDHFRKIERNRKKKGNLDIGCWKENKIAKRWSERNDEKLRQDAKMKAENIYQESKGKRIVRKQTEIATDENLENNYAKRKRETCIIFSRL